MSERDDNQEIERKFLLQANSWRAMARDRSAIRQGYLNLDPERTVRVRLRDERAVLTIKGRGEGLVRPEFEYAIPRAEAEAMLETLCMGEPVEKTRYLVDVGEHLWEIDVFEGANAGLVLAEVELSTADEHVTLPSWVGEEVSGDERYYNSQLAQCPFGQWEQAAPQE